MADEMKRIEVGFAGGQVMSARVTQETLKDLREAVERRDGWYDLEAEDGPVALDTAKVVFVRTAAAAHTIGFSNK
jgi:hypothetical protein